MLKFALGDRVFVHKPVAKSCKTYKFAQPFHQYYRTIQLQDEGADVTLVDKPKYRGIYDKAYYLIVVGVPTPLS